LNRLPQLDALRGIAALFVALSHSWAVFAMHGNSAYWMTGYRELPADLAILKAVTFAFNGNGAVIFFFVLSGFVLFRGLRPNESPQRYVWRRAVRLYPTMVLAALSCFIVTNVLFTTPMSGIHAAWFIGAFPQPLGWRNVVNTLLFRDASANPVLWTIGIEFCGSLLVFAMARWVNNIGLRLCLTGALLLVAVFAPAIGPIPYLFCFAAGTLLVGLRVPFPALLLAPACVSFFVVGLASNFFADWHIGFTISAMAIIVTAQDVQRGVLHSKAMTRFGEASYSFYAIHPAVLYVTVFIATSVGIAGVAGTILCTVASVAGAIGLSLWLYANFERPAMSLGRANSLART
jgi:peptidoglycan/LPS O-acetylase OafA/YrhL